MPRQSDWLPGYAQVVGMYASVTSCESTLRVALPGILAIDAFSVAHRCT